MSLFSEHLLCAGPRDLEMSDVAQDLRDPHPQRRGRRACEAPPAEGGTCAESWMMSRELLDRRGKGVSDWGSLLAKAQRVQGRQDHGAAGV